MQASSNPVLYSVPTVKQWVKYLVDSTPKMFVVFKIRALIEHDQGSF
jgi:hypothetical protein